MRVAVVDDLRTDAETLRGLLSKHLPPPSEEWQAET